MNHQISGYNAYQKSKYETASPHRLISMLYEGALKFSKQAIIHMENDDVAGVNIYLQRAQDIIYELISCLNLEQGKEVAQNLYNLYTYVNELYVKANIEKDSNFIHEANQIINELKIAWDEMGKELKVSHG